MNGARGATFARALVRIGHRAPVAVLVATAALVLVGVLLALRLKFDTDVLNLVPRHDPYVTTFRQVLEEFGSLDTVLLAVPVNGEENLDDSLALVDALAAELKQSPYLVHVESHLDDPVKLADAVLRHAVLFLDAKGLEALGERLTERGLAARAADIRAALDSPEGMIAKELAVRDPLGFLPLLLGRVASTPTSLKVDYASGYFLSADHSLALVLAKPTRPAQDIDFDRELFADLRERVLRARKQVAEERDLSLDEVPDVMLGGGHRIALEDAQLIKRDVVLNSISSLAGVMLLFLLAYRRSATLHYAFLPLAVGLALTFGFASLAIGRLSSATAGFAALLVGLGIDFTIVMYGRYLEARHNGAEIGPALDEMAIHTCPAVMLGALTTVGTFFSFLVTRFAGLRQFGLLTGTGIVFMGVSTFILLPALITLFDRGREPKAHPRVFNVDGVVHWAADHRRAVILAAVSLTALALTAIPFLSLDDDVRNLRSPSNRGVAIQEQVTSAFGLSFNSMMIRVEADSVPAAMAKVRTLDDGLQKLLAEKVVSSYRSLANLIPSPAAQQRALAWLKAHEAETDPARVRALFTRALAAEGLVPQAFEAGLDTLEVALRPPGPVSLDVWRGTPVEQVIARSLHVEDHRVATVITVFPPPNGWRRQAPPGLIDLVGKVDGAALTGINLVSQRLRHIVWRDAGIAGGVGLVVVLLLLLWEVRTWRGILACMLPVGLGVTWTLGLMAAMGYSLNLLNVFVTTMIIGVGSDYGIHMVHRMREGGTVNDLAETARAVLLAALTTVVGFGSLVTTHYPGLQSIGWMTSLGVLFSCVGAIVVLPAIFGTRRG